jgi:hypothetical protein
MRRNVLFQPLVVVAVIIRRCIVALARTNLRQLITKDFVNWALGTS